MNRKNLTAAVLAGLAGVAGIAGSVQAVNLNPDGLGQVLIYPYYTVNAGNQTVLSVVNTTANAKAVKVRFLEGKNSREVLDFNLYLSRWDVWVAAIRAPDTVCVPTEDVECITVPELVTNDSSCTVPYFYGDGPFGTQNFVPWALTDEVGYDPLDITTLGSINRATEGHFEMIEMGTVIADSESAIAMTHVDGVPADCASLVLAWTQLNDTDPDTKGYWLQNPLTDMTAPSGGLFGAASIIDVTQGAMYSYDAKAINGYATSVIAKDILHSEPGFTTPNLNSGDVGVAFAFLDNGVDVQWNFTRGVDAVSYVFMHDTIMNEYTTNDLVGADTEWVVTFPTKHFYVYPETSDSLIVLPPFTERWNGDDEKPNTACEVVLLATIWDREEGIPGIEETGEPIPPIVSPAPPIVIITDPIIPFNLCYETNVIAFGDDEGTGDILGSSNIHTINNDTLLFSSINGWARLELDDYDWDSDENGIIDCEIEEGIPIGPECNSRIPLGNLEGLPVAGFAVERFVNAFLGDENDILANYGGTFQHKGTVKLDPLTIELP